jgi:hypothetical protein
MFPLEAQYDGRVLDEEYVEKRAKWEPLYEATQIKGIARRKYLPSRPK